MSSVKTAMEDSESDQEFLDFDSNPEENEEASTGERYCYNKGCGLKYSLEQNADDACLYHPGPVTFHDAYKIWGCCNKKSTDFGTWLGFRGCTKGRHNPKKTADTATLPPTVISTPVIPETVVTWNGLMQPAARDLKPRVMSPILVTAAESAQIELDINNHGDDGQSDAIRVGMNCFNASCDKVYTGTARDEEECVYHPGTAIFHEGMKSWSCCERRTADFTNFLDQRGCSTGTHNWTRRGSVTKVRKDYFSQSGYIHMNVYLKGAITNRTQVVCNGQLVRMRIVHDLGAKRTDFNLNLFGEVIVEESTATVGRRKIEVKMKQRDAGNWPRLTYEVDPDSEPVLTTNLR